MVVLVDRLVVVRRIGVFEACGDAAGVLVVGGSPGLGEIAPVGLGHAACFCADGGGDGCGMGVVEGVGGGFV